MSWKMRTFLGGIVGLLALAAGAGPAAGATYPVTGIRAIDGDSIRVRFPSGLEVETRLLSIDCPEHGQALAEEAKAYTDGRIAGAALVLTTGPDERDRYQRLLAFVEVGGSLLNAELLERGLAAAYMRPPNTDRVDELLAAQERAHRNRLGMWGPGGPAEEPRSARARERDPERPLVPLRYENHLILGNQRSRVAHWPACRHREEILPENRRIFPRMSDALAAGYRMEKGFQ